MSQEYADRRYGISPYAAVSNFSISVRKDELNEKLRKEAQENAEKQIEKNRENAREKSEQLAEKMEEKEEEANADESKTEQVEKLLTGKLEQAEDGKEGLFR